MHTAVWSGAAALPAPAAHARFPQTDPPVVVCVHGLGGSHLNWVPLAARLATDGHAAAVWAPDLAGFGLTAPGGRRARIGDNLDLLAGFVRTVSPARPVVLVGNSMGGLLAVLLGARYPDLVAVSCSWPRRYRARPGARIRPWPRSSRS